MKRSLLFLTIAITLVLAFAQNSEVFAAKPSPYGLTYCVINGQTVVACGPGSTSACGGVRYCQ